MAVRKPTISEMASYKCELCCEDYDGSSRLPRVLSCGHTLCQSCVTTRPAATISTDSSICDGTDMSCSAGSFKCPFCEVLTVDTKLPINQFILDAIKPKITEQTDDKALNIILDILDSNGVSEKSLKFSSTSLGAEKSHKLPLRDKQMAEDLRKSIKNEESDVVKAMKNQSRHLGKLGHKMMEQNMDLCEVLRRHEKLLSDLEEEQRKLATVSEQGTQLMHQLKSTNEELNGLEESEQIIKSCRLAQRCCNAVDQWNFRAGDYLEKGIHKDCHEMRLKMDITLHAWEYSRVLSAKMRKLRSFSQLRSNLSSSEKQDNSPTKSCSNGEPIVDHEINKTETGNELTPLLNIFMYTISALEGGAQQVYGACRSDERVYTAKLFLHNELLHLHCLEEKTPPKGLVFDYEHLLNLADPQEPTMFLELNWGDKKQGNIYVVAENRAHIHILELLTGGYLLNKNNDNCLENIVNEETLKEKTEEENKNNLENKVDEGSVTNSNNASSKKNAVIKNVNVVMDEKKDELESSRKDDSDKHHKQLNLIAKKHKDIKLLIEFDTHSLRRHIKSLKEKKMVDRFKIKCCIKSKEAPKLLDADKLSLLEEGIPMYVTEGSTILMNALEITATSQDVYLSDSGVVLSKYR